LKTFAKITKKYPNVPAEVAERILTSANNNTRQPTAEPVDESNTVHRAGWSIFKGARNIFSREPGGP
jgi:hypothetical protein